MTTSDVKTNAGIRSWLTRSTIYNRHEARHAKMLNAYDRPVRAFTAAGGLSAAAAAGRGSCSMATSLAFPEDTTRIDFGEMAVPDDSTSSSTTGVAGQQQAKKKSLMVPSVAAAAAMAAWAASRSTFIKVAGYNTRSCASAVCFHSSVLARDTNYPLAATTQLHYPSRLLPFDQSHHLNRHKHHLLQLKPPQLSLLKTPVLVLQLLLLRQTPTTTHTTAGTLFVARRAVPFLVGYEIARRGLLPQQPIRH